MFEISVVLYYCTRRLENPVAVADVDRTVDLDVGAYETAHTLPLLTAPHCSSTNTDPSRSSVLSLSLGSWFSRHLLTTQVRQVHQYDQPEFHRHKR